jgi:kexin
LFQINSIMSCSWGPTDDGRRLEAPGPLAKLAMMEAVKSGRNGLGTIFVWAGGNGRRNGDNCNYDGYANSRYTITVGAVGYDNVQSWYSESCSAMMVVAPSSSSSHFPSIVTTDLRGSRG